MAKEFLLILLFALLSHISTVVNIDEVPDASISTVITTPKSTKGKKAKEKCREYSTWLEEDDWSVNLESGKKRERKAGICGIASEPLIVGGIEASPMEFPHMAHLRYDKPNGQQTWECGGSLISEQFILTAAHCLTNDANVPVSHVRLGSGDFSTMKIVKVNKTIPHPLYNKNFVYHDIALLKLENSQDEFNDYMRPACVHTLDEIGQDSATASGWGTTRHGGSQNSPKLLKVDLPIWSRENCTRKYPGAIPSLPRGIENSSQVCAGKGGKDSCSGDSGGPLQIIPGEPECMYNIVGIISFGVICGGSKPGVYTRVSRYIDWIESHVWA